MKLLIISADFPPTQSGEASHAYHLARHLAKRGVEVHVLTTRVPGAVKSDTFTVHPIMNGWAWPHLFRFRKFLRRLRPDAVLFLFLGGMYGHHPMMSFAPTIARRLVPQLRFVTQFEYTGNYIFNSGFWALALRKAMLKCLRKSSDRHDYFYGTLLHDSHGVIVLRDAHKEALFGQYPSLEEKCTLIPAPPLVAMTEDAPHVARKKGRDLLDLRADNFLLVYYGYLYPGKGLETLLRALALLCPRHPELRLAIVGGFLEHKFSSAENEHSQNYMQRIHALTNELGIQDKLIWTGPCTSTSEKASLYFHAADASVFPFDAGVHLNNSSVSAAIAHNVPLITTHGPDTEDAFIHRTTALLCEPKDSHALAGAIGEVIEDGELRRRLREGAAAMSSEYFSWNTAIDRTLELLSPCSSLQSRSCSAVMSEASSCVPS